MEKFTKGPWEIKPIEDEKEYIRIRGTVLGGRFKICNVNDAKLHHSDELKWCAMEREESMANAHLIAAAPEMYDLLSTIENDSNQVPEWLWQKIQKTLAKARGEL